MVALTINSDIVFTKGHNIVAAVLLDVDYSNKAEFDGHAAVNESGSTNCYKKLDHWFLKQLPGYGSPNGSRPPPSSSLAGQPALAPPGGRRFRS